MMIDTSVTPLAQEALTESEQEFAVQAAYREGERNGWKPGQTIRLNFKKAGRGWTVALDRRKDKVVGWIGLPQELIFQPGGET